MLRLAAFVLLGLAAAAALPRRRPVAIAAVAPPVTPGRISYERWLLLCGPMPSRSVH